jgi:hypothetical protein
VVVVWAEAGRVVEVWAEAARVVEVRAEAARVVVVRAEARVDDHLELAHARIRLAHAPNVAGAPVALDEDAVGQPAQRHRRLAERRHHLLA